MSFNGNAGYQVIQEGGPGGPPPLGTHTHTPTPPADDRRAHRVRLESAAQRVAKAAGGVPRRTLSAELALAHGVTLKTAREDVRLLLASGLVDVEDRDGPNGRRIEWLVWIGPSKTAQARLGGTAA